MENYATIIKDKLALCQLTKKGLLQYIFKMGKKQNRRKYIRYPNF